MQWIKSVTGAVADTVASPAEVKVVTGINHLSSHKSLLVKQSPKGCCHHCLCRGPLEFNVATLKSPKTNLFSVEEKSNICCRCCFPNCHPFDMRMTLGSAPGGEAVASFERPLRCAMIPGKCCCKQSITIKDDKDVVIGSVMVRTLHMFNALHR